MFHPICKIIYHILACERYASPARSVRSRRLFENDSLVCVLCLFNILCNFSTLCNPAFSPSPPNQGRISGPGGDIFLPFYFLRTFRLTGRGEARAEPLYVCSRLLAHSSTNIATYFRNSLRYKLRLWFLSSRKIGAPVRKIKVDIVC